MTNILTIDDFIGTHQISVKLFGDDKFASYLSECQEDVFRKVLGDFMADELQTQIDAETIESKYNDLIDGILYTSSNSIVKRNKGLKTLLLGITYYKIVGDNFTASSTGSVNIHNENSKRRTPTQNTQDTNRRYNRASMLYDSDIWPFLEFYKQSSGIITSSVDNTGT